jgi:hypothetical protein
VLVTLKVWKPPLTASDEMMSVESAVVVEPLAVLLVRVSDDSLDAIHANELEVIAHKDEAAQAIADMYNSGLERMDITPSTEVYVRMACRLH